MFKRRPIRVDAVNGSKKTQHVTPRAASAAARENVDVTTMPRRKGGATVPDEYRTLDRARGGGSGFIIFLVVLFLATAGGFYYLNKNKPAATGPSVDFTVTGPSEIVSGDEVVFAIEYENRDTVAFSSVELDVQWPEGFYYNSSDREPRSESATTWVLGPLDPGQKKTLEIRGQLVGVKDQTQEAVFRLAYRPANISSDFEEERSVAVRISDARLGLELVADQKVLAGANTKLTATVQNLTGEPLPNIDIEVLPPASVDITSTDPVLTENHWRGELSASDPLALTVNGKAVAEASGSEPWIVEINENVDGQVRRLLRKEFPVAFVTPSFGLELKINGQSQDFEADYGDTLNFQAKVVNTSNAPMTDIRVTALLDSDIIDRKTVSANGTIGTETITWTKDNAEGLASLEPGAETILTWRAQLLGSGTVGRSTVDTLVTVELEGLSGWKQNGSVFVVSVGEGIVFNQGLYWELGGQQVGSGNIPPVTNERTEYLVVWSIDAGSQEFQTVTISSFLPEKVLFVSEDDVDEGSLTYDQETNRIAWTIDAFSTQLLPLKAAFVVRLVPRDEDTGSIMTVINAPTIVASGAKDFQAQGFALTTTQVIGADDIEAPGIIIE